MKNETQEQQTSPSEVAQEVPQHDSVILTGPPPGWFPSIGRQVHYVAKPNSHQGHRGGQHYPATVVEVHSPTCLTLSVLSTSDNYPVHILSSIMQDESGAEGTWHWPERI